MKYVKTFEIFGFGKKKRKPNPPQTWKIRLEWILNNWKDKSKYQSLDANYKNDTCIISYSNKYGFHHIGLVANEKENEYKVSYNVTGEWDDWPEITKEEYVKYRKGIIEISDHLDETENISDTTVYDILNMSKGESDYLKGKSEVYTQLRKFLQNFIGKELEFEARYHLWSSNSENKKIVDTIKIKIQDIEEDILRSLATPNKSVKFKCTYRGEDFIMSIWENTIEEYVDLSKVKPWETFNLIDLNRDDSKLSRKEKRKGFTYPHFINMDLSPLSYESIQLIKACKEIIESAKG